MPASASTAVCKLLQEDLVSDPSSTAHVQDDSNSSVYLCKSGLLARLLFGLKGETIKKNRKYEWIRPIAFVALAG